jgi:hypothetical protein
MVRSDPKLYEVGPFLFGFTSSYRMGQLLGYKFHPPVHASDCPIEKFMATSFIDAVRTTFKDGGYAITLNGQESGGSFLVGYRGRLFRVCDDFQVGEAALGYDAVGCGAEVALGALYAARARSPIDRLKIALSAAESMSAGVRAPFIFLKNNGSAQ